MKYSIVIPCYNEEDNLPNLIKSISEFAKGKEQVMFDQFKKFEYSFAGRPLVIETGKVAMLPIVSWAF